MFPRHAKDDIGISQSNKVLDIYRFCEQRLRSKILTTFCLITIFYSRTLQTPSPGLLRYVESVIAKLQLRFAKSLLLNSTEYTAA